MGLRSGIWVDMKLEMLLYVFRTHLGIFLLLFIKLYDAY